MKMVSKGALPDQRSAEQALPPRKYQMKEAANEAALPATLNLHLMSAARIDTLIRMCFF
jgi:hypothetical protein